MEESLRSGEDRFRSLFTGMTEGFALHEIICDETGEPIDYRFLDVNPAFERLTGLTAGRVVGRRVMEVLPDTEPYWVRNYGKVALSGEPMHFDNYSRALGRHYDVFAYRPAPRQFAAIFMDITERKRAEEALQAARDELERRVEERTAALSQSNRLLRLLSESNQALVTLDNEQELIRAICQIMHEQGGYRMAWVGYAEQDEERSVRPIAFAGFEDGYLDSVRDKLGGHGARSRTDGHSHSRGPGVPALGFRHRRDLPPRGERRPWPGGIAPRSRCLCSRMAAPSARCPSTRRSRRPSPPIRWRSSRSSPATWPTESWRCADVCSATR